MAALCPALALAVVTAQAWAAKDDVELVSRATGATGAKGNDHSYWSAISADARFVAFVSSASNLHPDANNNREHIFVRDLDAGTTTLVSRATGATGGKGDGWNADISADGRFVAFTSASNLHPDDDDFLADVFVRDLQTNTTTLVSRSTGVTGAKGNGNPFEPAISADGRFVAFHSSFRWPAR